MDDQSQDIPTPKLDVDLASIMCLAAREKVCDFCLRILESITIGRADGLRKIFPPFLCLIAQRGIRVTESPGTRKFGHRATLNRGGRENVVYPRRSSKCRLMALIARMSLNRVARRKMSFNRFARENPHNRTAISRGVIASTRFIIGRGIISLALAKSSFIIFTREEWPGVQLRNWSKVETTRQLALTNAGCHC